MLPLMMVVANPNRILLKTFTTAWNKLFSQLWPNIATIVSPIPLLLYFEYMSTVLLTILCEWWCFIYNFGHFGLVFTTKQLQFTLTDRDRTDNIYIHTHKNLKEHNKNNAFYGFNVWPLNNFHYLAGVLAKTIPE